MAELSLILPVYNRAHLMEYVFLSLRNQSHIPEEIIVIDDNSSDSEKLVKVIYDFQDLKIIYKRLTRCLGYFNSSHPYNVGIKTATKDVVVYCAGELIHLPENFELIARYIRQDVFLMGGTFFSEAKDNRYVDMVKRNPKRVFDVPHDTWHPNGYYGNDIVPVKFYDSDSAVHAVFREHLMYVRGFDESLTSWGHNDQQMRRRLTKLLGLKEIRIPEITTIHQWHERAPVPNMEKSTEQRLVSENLPLIVNEGVAWGE